MKIVVLGAGNAGSMTALLYAFYSKKHEHIEIELIHDPNVQSETVGQATLTEHPTLLWMGTGFNWYENKIHATFKSGILYEGWGKINEKIFHPFPSGSMAMHYCPWEMQKSVLESGYFKVTESDVVNTDDIDADFIIDCRGKPRDFEGYDLLNNPTNSTILGSPNWDMSEQHWSRHVATPDGWTFVIPTHPDSPSHKFCVGYCYNDRFTSQEDAEKNMKNIFDVKINKHLKYKNYVAKKPIDDRIVLSGNKLFFLEPMESSSTHAYLEWAKMVWEYIFNGVENPSDRMIQYIHQLESFILYHYQFGSKYNSKFWDYASKLTFDDSLLDRYIDIVKTHDEHDLFPVFSDIDYGQWHIYSIKNWYDGNTSN